ncbi:MAG: lysophospholipid acyltransferase family protein [Candidatus Delongbacteria bacterium]|jgi:monolysocardiolipin acyltransferase|nr:lysophospholipid acyltransferase family protein [Candidatus Delongbacteria bacterium]
MTEKEKNKIVDHWKAPNEGFFFIFMSKFVTFLTSIFVWFWMYVLNSTKFYEKKIISREKAPYVFASNHTTMFDSGFIDCIVFLKRGMFDYKFLPYHTPEYGNFYKNWFMSMYMNYVKCIPLERGKGIDQFAQKLVTKKLQQGGIVHIFPEGTRSRSGDLLPGKAGVGKRIYESKVRAIPCYHEGIRDILPVGKSMPRIGKKVRVIIGEPIFFDEFFDMPNIPDTWKQISQKIMDEINKLKGELHEREKR